MLKERLGIFHQYRWLMSNIQRLLDGLVVFSVLLLLCWLYRIPLNQEIFILGGVTFLLVLVIFKATKLYRPWRGVNSLRLIRQIVLSWILVVMLLLILGYATKTSTIYSRMVVFSWVALTPLGLVLFRFFTYIGLHWARARGRNSRSVVIGGASDLGHQLAHSMMDNPWLGMRLFGFFDDGKVGEKVVLNSGGLTYPVLGDLDDMVTFVQEHKIDMVYLALPLRAEERLREIMNALQDTTASVYFAPNIFAFSFLQATLTDLQGIPLISLCETPFYGIFGWLKRAEDILLSTFILLLTAPLMLLIALGVKFFSPGPVLFKQRRYGIGGEEIIVYKFRTMTVCQDGLEIPQAKPNDSRVTSLGAFLRRTSLDELPQVFNVLKGDMSIVGPRPHAVAHNEYYRRRVPGYMLRHKVRPGITGWAQINGSRGETDTLEKMEKRIKFDLDYIGDWSIGLDLKIIFLTIFRLPTDKRAY